MNGSVGVVQAYGLALGELREPGFRRVMAIALVVTVAVFALLLAGAVWATGSFVDPARWGGWLEPLAQALGGIAVVGLAWLAYPIVITAALGFFLDDIAELVERRHYPADAPGREVALLPGLAQGLRFAGKALAVNILILPLYLISFILPILTPFLFYAVNGYLLGQEYFGQVGLRHASSTDVRAVARANRGRVFLAGLRAPSC